MTNNERLYQMRKMYSKRGYDIVDTNCGSIMAMREGCVLFLYKNKK